MASLAPQPWTPADVQALRRAWWLSTSHPLKVRVMRAARATGKSEPSVRYKLMALGLTVTASVRHLRSESENQ